MDITYSLQYVLEFQSDHVQWQSRGKVGVGLGGASTHFIQRFKNLFFQQIFRPKYA